MSQNNSIFLATLEDVVSWQINFGEATQRTKYRVLMPAIQRGYVWSTSQVEGLWDSLIRKLPIGSFLVTPFDKNLVTTKLNDNTQNFAKSDAYLLLDGQQRATSIALAFTNPWKATENPQEYPLALWLDIAQPDVEGHFTDRAFMFRVVTKSHPWGYKRNTSARLEAKERKKALEAFRTSIREFENLDHDAQLPDYAQYPGFNIAYSWPWDAKIPLPFSLFCEAVRETKGIAWEEELIRKINANTYWKEQMPTQHTECWKGELINILKDKTSYEYKRIQALAEELPEILKTSLPVIIVPQNDADLKSRLQSLKKESEEKSPEQPPTDTSEDNSPDAIESLFVRINSAGTPLEGDELIYSIYKSIWPDTQTLVEQIGNNAYIKPAKLIAIIARLVLSIKNDEEVRDKKELPSMPPALNVTRFRSLIYSADGEYKKALERFMEDTAEKLFQEAKEFMAGNGNNQSSNLLKDKNDFRLGSILMENVAKSCSSDVYFFFLRWLHDKNDELKKYRKKTQIIIQRRIIGALTAILFFAPKPELYIKKLWKIKSKKWWNHKSLCTNEHMIHKENELIMIPLPSPKEFRECLGRCTLIQSSTPEEWRNWNWYEKISSKYPKGNNSHYASCCKHLLSNYQGQEHIMHTIWRMLFDKIRNERRLVMYAQRYWAGEFFKNYNPAAPDQLEDSDRPYDWDHIFPQSYIQGKHHILNVWRRGWISTIGNIRMWPMELNRGDGDILPHMKLVEDEILEASFVEKKDWICTNMNSIEANNVRWHLKEKTPFGLSLQNAIVNRLVALYKEWYEELRIGDSFGVG